MSTEKRHTRSDVARLAGVSTATVSNVFNQKGNISELTRQRVFAVAKELQYQPNMIARSMVTKETYQLSILLNDFANPYYSDIVKGFENEAWTHGYFVYISSGYRDLASYCDSIINRRVDGVFVTMVRHADDDEQIKKLLRAGIKVVVSGYSDIDHKQANNIDINYDHGMEQAMHYLYELGHRDIIYLNGLTRTNSPDQRTFSFLRIAEALNLSDYRSLVVNNKYVKKVNETTQASGKLMTEKLIRSGRNFTAIIATNDLMAVGAIRALTKAGIRVPEDVSVVGFDNIYITEIWHPKITTVSVDKTLLGQKAFQLLFANMKHMNTGYYQLDTKLLIRESTGPVRQSKPV